MQHPYGKPVGVAARVRRGDPIIVARVSEGNVEIAKDALKRAADKFPLPCKVIVKQNN
jgi:large subunit ribosomal protein L10e